jgi:type II secretory pathway component PulF
MSTFRYVAARPDGLRVRGWLEAGSAPEAARLLSDRGLFPVRVEAAGAPRSFWPTRRARQAATIMESLASLARIGVPLDRALDATAELLDRSPKEALGRVRQRVREGSTLAIALAGESDLFPAVSIALVRAGERGAGLAAGLEQAARHLAREADTRDRLRAALAYPVTLLAVGTVSLAAIVLVVMPRFAALLGDVQSSLPPLTRGVLAAGTALRRYGALVAVGSASALGAAIYLVRSHAALWAARLLEAPLVGSIRHGFATARVARVLSALLETGVPASRALGIAGEAAGDAEVQRRLQLAAQQVAEGGSLGEALGCTRAVTAGAVQLVRIGERSGRLPALLRQAADLEEQAAARGVHALVTALEPALIIALAGFVALIAGALLQAIYAVRPGGL